MSEMLIPAEVNMRHRELMQRKEPTVLKAMPLAPRDGTLIIVFDSDFSGATIVAWVKWSDGSASWANAVDEDERGDDKDFPGWIDCPPDVVAGVVLSREFRDGKLKRIKEAKGEGKTDE